MNLKLIIAYDGRPYLGWASQPHKNTIQDHIQKAIQKVAKRPISIFASGRTDAGVHAVEQVAHFELPDDTIHMNPYNWVPALNSKLPPSIRIMSCEEVEKSFHSRFSASQKTYQYRLSFAPVLPPMLAGRAWHLPRQLNNALLQKALQNYLGEHDFRQLSALRGNETKDTDYRRIIHQAEVFAIDQGCLITFTANGFLYKMVRMLTGAAVQVAQGKVTLEEHLSFLQHQSSYPKQALCAPPNGLSLLKVFYD